MTIQQLAAKIHPVKHNEDDMSRAGQIDLLVTSLSFQTCMAQASCSGCPLSASCPL